MGRRSIRGRRVVPGTEQSTVPLTRRSRMAKWHLRKGDMMVFGRPMGGAGRRSVGRLGNYTGRISSTRRDENPHEMRTY